MVFIKSIQINGFKTYKNQVFGDDKGLAQELSPGVNSIGTLPNLILSRSERFRKK
jgi:hypothetical protein